MIMDPGNDPKVVHGFPGLLARIRSMRKDKLDIEIIETYGRRQI
jgi:hypothetical protein